MAHGKVDSFCYADEPECGVPFITSHKLLYGFLTCWIGDLDWF